MKNEKCTIRLNHDCKSCNKAIYINQYPITTDIGMCHLKCLIFDAMHDCNGVYPCEESTNPAEMMADIILQKINYDEKLYE